MTDKSEELHLKRSLSFLKEIGIEVIEKELTEKTFVPGLSLGVNSDSNGCIYMDRKRMLYPGDLLHEAGHLAVCSPEIRKKIGSSEIEGKWPDGGEELGAVLWSYAACVHLNLPLEFVFHPKGYKNESQWLISTFKNGVYIGLPFLVWIGLCLDEQEAQIQNQQAFPHMLKWVRN